jgi:hypothetical protein
MKKIILSTFASLLLLNAAPPIISVKNTIQTVTQPDTITTGATQATTGTDTNTPATSATSWSSRKTTNGTPQADDILYGAGSKNIINGLADNDYIHPVDVEAWDNRSKYYGDAGNDWIELTRGTKVIVDGGTGNDTIVNYHGTGWHTTYKLYGGAGNDKFYATIEGKDDIYYGGTGLDTIVLTGTISQYAIYYSGSNPTKYTFYYRASGTPSTWNYDSKFVTYEIEKWVWSTTGIPPAPGVAEVFNKTSYISEDKNNSLSTTPTAVFVSTLPTQVMYKLPVSITVTTPGEVFIRNMPVGTLWIENNATNQPLGNIIVKNEYDINDIATGVQTKQSYVLTPANMQLNIVRDVDFTQAEIDAISITPKLGF